ncbi:Putative zinc binding metallopeptidase [Corynebacterium glyciniphilum AJ 3170]|uniref:Putative zinc binding metallopeptidase n=1 Tax=Corynebacterium glyciniphilum AJ 3170 TaxID=1404245 RepID=X5E9I4_9CORY|nr:neutral zinc metallopeptidase [Corynebacterium glyciniphilum]AHW64090.1 Putative zinc binding metallopeptidase [Corynebacterium glyciniphilum AJ 3170]
MSFNNNLSGMGGRARSGGSSGGGGFGIGGGGRQGGNRGGGILGMLLMSRIGRRFGIPGILVVAVVLFFANGGLGMFGADSSRVSEQGADGAGGRLDHCTTVEDANTYDDCRIEGTAISLDTVWSSLLPDQAGINYSEPGLVIGDGQVNTGCGTASTAQTGPFYCPGDETVYIGDDFFSQLSSMGGSDGPFAQMYVVAHEFGHHIQHLEGNLGLSDYDDPGEDSNAVKMELQADCYAGVWASHADKGEDAVLDPVTPDQVNQAITSAQAIGDDAIQSVGGGQVTPDAWTHGSSEQRQRWFTTGYDNGTMASCQQNFR